MGLVDFCICRLGRLIGNESHGWLEIGDYINDITSDQFDDGKEPVYVGKDRTFHDKYEIQCKDDVKKSNILELLCGASSLIWTNTQILV